MNQEYSYKNKEFWNRQFIDYCPPARKELREQPVPQTQKEHVRRLGDSDFDIEAFINSKMGEAVADLQAGYPSTGSDVNPAADLYWKERGYDREYHPEDRREHSWVSLVPSDLAEGEKLPEVVLIHGGQANGLASDMEASGYVHEVIKRDRAVFVLPANTETDNTIYAMDRADPILPIDKTRVYIIGFSGGGAWARYTALTHPERFAAYAPNGSNLMSWPALADDAMLAKVREIGLPVCIYAGLREFLRIFPLNQNGVKFTGILGKDEQPGTPEEKYMLFRRCLYASGCSDISPEECMKAAGDPDPARQMCGAPGGDAKMIRLLDTDHAVIDYMREDGTPGMRIICVDNMPHVVSPSAAGLVWEFLRQFKRY